MKPLRFRGLEATAVSGWPRPSLVWCGAVASGLCLLGLWARGAWLGRPALQFLNWNLLLAWVPVALNVLRGLGALALHGRPGRHLVLVPLDLAWLSFLPNAPYLVTDLVHLAPRAGVPFWYDVLLFCGYAGTGCWLGVTALDAALARVKSGSLKVAVGSALCFASGYGVYLGRFWRFNSWNVVDQPSLVLAQALGSLTHRTPLAFSVAFAVFLALPLWALQRVLHMSPTETSGPISTR